MTYHCIIGIRSHVPCSPFLLPKRKLFSLWIRCQELIVSLNCKNEEKRHLGFNEICLPS